MKHDDKLIVALDVESYDEAAKLVEQLSGHLNWFKIGSKLFTREGPRVCRMIKDAGGKLFLDLKYHDIPNTVYGAVRSAMDLDADMLTLHASGGHAMLQKAREAADDAGRSDCILVAVTVLTHLDIADFGNIFGTDRDAETMITSLAGVARESGMTGVVASAKELRIIKSHMGEDFTVVTPGIRLPDGSKDDQTRVVTPEQAIADGADFVVVGRPIIAAEKPTNVCREIISRMNTV